MAPLGSAEQLGGLFAGEFPELDTVERAGTVGALDRCGEPTGDLARPQRQRRENRGGGRPAQQGAEQLDGRGVGPVEVVEEEDQRLRGREELEQLAGPRGGSDIARAGAASRTRCRATTATGRPARAHYGRRRRARRAGAARGPAGTRRARRRRPRTAGRARARRPSPSVRETHARLPGPLARRGDVSCRFQAPRRAGSSRRDRRRAPRGGGRRR